jgi:two-component system phosphate regulon sensor histidine kinase PhoR
MRIKARNLRTKLLFSYLFIVLVSFTFVAYFLDKNLEKLALQEIKSSLINQANLIESQIPAEKLKAQDSVFLNGLAITLAKKIQGRITIIDLSGKVLADSERNQQELAAMENHAERPEIKSALSSGIGEELRYSSTLKIDMLYIAISIREGRGVIGVVRLALPLTQIQKQLAAVRNTILVSLIFALGLAFVLGSLLAESIVKPINRIIHGARKFSQGDFNYQILLDSKDEIGQLAEVLNKMAQDIEDKIKELEVRNQHLAAILQSMVEGIIVVDNRSRILSLNSPAERIFNITKNEAQNKLFLEVIPNNNIVDLINEVLEKKEFLSRELSLIWPVQKIFRIDVSPIFEKNRTSGCLIVIHDITEIRRLETMRRDFVANVSHELKTPLTSIKGFTETLLEGAWRDEKNVQHFLGIIREHAQRLDNLVNDLLSLAHMEVKDISLDKSEIKIKELVDEILAGFSAQLKKRHIQAHNDLPLKLSVKAHQDKLNQVFTNLVDNAIKFNKEGGSVRIYSRESADLIKIIVEDTGIGIPPKDLSRIFERFYRVDKGRSREMGGTGLGLAIVKHIVELHGGMVGVESNEGLGATFWFSLPK